MNKEECLNEITKLIDLIGTVRVTEITTQSKIKLNVIKGLWTIAMKQ